MTVSQPVTMGTTYEGSRTWQESSPWGFRGQPLVLMCLVKSLASKRLETNQRLYYVGGHVWSPAAPTPTLADHAVAPGFARSGCERAGLEGSLRRAEGARRGDGGTGRRSGSGGRGLALERGAGAGRGREFPGRASEGRRKAHGVAGRGQGHPQDGRRGAVLEGGGRAPGRAPRGDANGCAQAQHQPAPA